MGPGHSILIIDDEPNLRRSLGLILQRAGYSVITAANAGKPSSYYSPDPMTWLSWISGFQI